MLDGAPLGLLTLPFARKLGLPGSGRLHTVRPPEPHDPADSAVYVPTLTAHRGIRIRVCLPSSIRIPEGKGWTPHSGKLLRRSGFGVQIYERILIVFRVLFLLSQATLNIWMPPFSCCWLEPRARRHCSLAYSFAVAPHSCPHPWLWMRVDRSLRVRAQSTGNFWCAFLELCQRLADVRRRAHGSDQAAWPMSMLSGTRASC